MRLLHLDASPRADRSRSRTIARHFLDELPNSYSHTTYDLWSMSLPSLDGCMIEGRYDLIMGQPVPAQVAEEWAKIEQVASAFREHDALLISTPMWNFGIPYRLKHFIDVVTQPGMAFRNDAAGKVEGLLAGKPAVIIASSAMPFGSDPGIASLDFQARYLESWLNFIGITEIDLIRVAPTFGPEDAVAAAMAAGAVEARALAQEWAASR